jgi:uncharacterized protein
VPFDYSSKQVYPLFPLHTVLFPGGALPLRIFEPRYVDMVGTCLRDGREFGVVPIAQGNEVRPGAAFHPDGTLARIETWDLGKDGLLELLVRGTQRFRVLEHATAPDGLVSGQVGIVDEDDEPVPAMHHYLGELLAAAYAAHPDLAPPNPWSFDSAAWIAYRCAELMPLDLPARLEILTLDSPQQKLATVAKLLPPPERPMAGSALH